MQPMLINAIQLCDLTVTLVSSQRKQQYQKQLPSSGPTVLSINIMSSSTQYQPNERGCSMVGTLMVPVTLAPLGGRWSRVEVRPRGLDELCLTLYSAPETHDTRRCSAGTGSAGRANAGTGTAQ